jgi:hypothetical protein
MRIAWIGGLLLAFTVGLRAQVAKPVAQPDLRILLCWNSEAERPLAHDRVLQLSIGRVMALDGVAKTIDIRFGACSGTMTDAACFGAPGGVMCQLTGIERILRAAAWITVRYRAQGAVSYEEFWKHDPEYVGHAFRYADGADSDANADAMRESVADDKEAAKPFFDALVEYNLAALLGHETAHAHDDDCPLTSKSVGEDTGLLPQIIDSEESGDLFAKHAPVPEEIKGDRCGMRHLRAFNERLKTQPAIQYPDSAEALRRSASDMVVFQSVFGWRRFTELANGTQLPKGRYVFFTLDSYLYSPFRAVLFSREIAGSSPSPYICGTSAQLIVQSIQETYKKHEGNGKVGDNLLALFPKGVETSWNGAAWTPESYSCRPAPSAN